MSTSSGESSGTPPPGRGADHDVPTPLDVAAAFEAPPGVRDTSGAPRAAVAVADEGDRADLGDLADRVVAAVLAVPGVVRLHSGAFGEVATYLPGRAVTGVRLRPDGAEVHLVVSSDRPVPEVAGDAHEAVRVLVPGPVHVFIEDVDLPPTSPAP